AGMEVELPVLLADAVYSPARSPKAGQDFVEYGIGSAQANLNIVLPAALAFDRVRLDQAFALMAEHVQDEKEYDVVEVELIKAGLMSVEEGKSWHSALSSTYGQVLELHRKAWNG